MVAEGDKSTRYDLDLLPPKLPDGKDELNLAEFPLSAIADRLNPDQKTLTFEDRIFDANRNEMISRQLTITASDEYGLPTALDDEVLLGLVQLSKVHNFTDRRVGFTRYQLLRLLGWREESKGYDRLEKSLNRWVGVTLYYKNAWWSKEEQCWVDEKFHILDNVTLYDREKGRSSPSRQSQLPLSSFTWNDVIFRSFKAGNLKSIDFDFLKHLQSAVAKRLYRFLDKRFFHRSRWEFNLNEVCLEHIGLSRNYDAANLKRKLLPAIKELEEQGFLIPMPEELRFTKVCSGEWRVVFQDAKTTSLDSTKTVADDARPLIEALVERGVTQCTAQQTVAAHAANRIKTQLEVFDWLVAKHDPKVTRNPAGFLVASIKSEYAPPRGFVGRDEQVRRKTRAEQRKAREEAKARAEAATAEAQSRARAEVIQRFWEEFSEQERTRLENEALDQAKPLERDLIERGGAFAESTRKALLDAYALRTMQVDS